MDRKAFFKELRSSKEVFGRSLSQRQVQGTEAILDAGAHLVTEHLAHVLGEVYHETGGGMFPIKETVFASHSDKNPSDERVRARLESAWKKGKLPWVKTPYWRTGFFGRGQIQLTHESNYEKFSPIVGVDLVRNPGKALNLKISGQIAVTGCEKGLFTGKKLADYDTSHGYDHNAARRIVNGYVRKQAADVEKAAKAFSKALRAAGHAPQDHRPPSPPDHVTIPKTENGRPGLVEIIVAFIKALFGRK